MSQLQAEGDFFLCKQKTAYEMRISDWSSDVCSSDLGSLRFQLPCSPTNTPSTKRAPIAGDENARPSAATCEPRASSGAIAEATFAGSCGRTRGSTFRPQ